MEIKLSDYPNYLLWQGSFRFLAHSDAMKSHNCVSMERNGLVFGLPEAQINLWLPKWFPYSHMLSVVIVFS